MVGTMIKITDSTVFNTNADCIVNTINCVGFMGKGLALEFALRYPKLEEQYVLDCRRKLIHTGRVYLYEFDGQKIINFPTKFHFKHPSRIEWIEQGLKDFLCKYKDWGIKSVAFPMLGTSNGGLDPMIVESLMIKILEPLDIDVYICHSKLVEGKELEMVNVFKDMPISHIKKHVRLTEKQAAILDAQKKEIVRFSDILKIEGIGVGIYKCIYKLCNAKELHGEEQLSLF